MQPRMELGRTQGNLLAPRHDEAAHVKKGCQLTEAQNNQYYTITNQNPWDLKLGIHALNVMDQCAHDQSGSSRTSRVYAVEDDQQHNLIGEEDYEDDVVDVLVNLPDLVDLDAVENSP